MHTILIDDNSTSVFLTELLLKREGFAQHIHSFGGAQEALDYLHETLPTRVPDVIFLDLNMPLMDGWEFLDALEPYQEKLAQRCRIYILTSSLAPTDAVRAKDYPLVSGLVHKPVDSQMLRSIREEISGRN
ncbi:response regulator [Hymenobacter koreensis]|uniref:Response regulator n=1 Tax=Hymenobacter koreensis TaxID=1084523 RepID=A0ABP8JPG9_9BACT